MTQLLRLPQISKVLPAAAVTMADPVARAVRAVRADPVDPEVLVVLVVRVVPAVPVVRVVPAVLLPEWVDLLLHIKLQKRSAVVRHSFLSPPSKNCNLNRIMQLYCRM